MGREGEFGVVVESNGEADRPRDVVLAPHGVDLVRRLRERDRILVLERHAGAPQVLHHPVEGLALVRDVGLEHGATVDARDLLEPGALQHAQLRRGVAGGDRPDLPRLQDGDPLPGAREKQRRRQAREAAADHDSIELAVDRELVGLRAPRQITPQGGHAI
jgi:hypothetical protein